MDEDILNIIEGGRQYNEDSFDEEETVETEESSDLEDYDDEVLGPDLESEEFDSFMQSENEDYESFLESLFSGEVDGFAMGDKATEIYNAYGTTDVRKARKYQTSSGSTLSSLIASRESDDSGSYRALPRKADGSLASSAAGKYQFLWNTHHDWISKLTGVRSKEEFLNSPQAQEEAFEHWDRTTLTPQANKYKRALPQYSEDEIKLMLHFAGAGNVEKAIRTGNFNRPLDGFGSSINSYLGKKQYGGPVKPKNSAIRRYIQDEDSEAMNVAEIFDPTGITSYDDVYREYKKSGMSWNTALETVGALPVIGKVGKGIKLLKGASKIEKTDKFLNPVLKRLDRLDNITPAASQISEFTGNILNNVADKSLYGVTRKHNINPASRIINGINTSTDISGASPKYAYGGPIKDRRAVMPSDATRNKFSRDKIHLDPKELQRRLDRNNYNIEQTAGMVPIVGSLIDAGNIAVGLRDNDKDRAINAAISLGFSMIPYSKVEGAIVNKMSKAVKYIKSNPIGTALKERKLQKAVDAGNEAIRKQYSGTEGARRMLEIENSYLPEYARPDITPQSIEAERQYLLKNLEKPAAVNNWMVGPNNAGLYHIGHGTGNYGAYVGKNATHPKLTTIHEMTHQLTDGAEQMLPVTKQLLSKPFRYKFNDKNEFIDHISDTYDSRYVGYITDPAEIHSRVNELRHVLNPDNPFKKLEYSDWDRLNTEAPKQGLRDMLNMVSDKKEFIDMMNKMYTPAAVTALGAKAINDKNKKKNG